VPPYHPPGGDWGRTLCLTRQLRTHSTWRCPRGSCRFPPSHECPSRIGVYPYCKGATRYSCGKKDRQKEGGWRRKKRKKTKKQDKRATLSSLFSPFFGYGGFGCPPSAERPRWVPPRFCDPRFSASPLRLPASFVRFLFTNFLSAYVARG